MATSVGTVNSKLLLLILECYSLTQHAYIPSKGICLSTLTKLLDVKEETQKSGVHKALHLAGICMSPYCTQYHLQMKTLIGPIQLIDSLYLYNKMVLVSFRLHCDDKFENKILNDHQFQSNKVCPKKEVHHPSNRMRVFCCSWISCHIPFHSIPCLLVWFKVWRTVAQNGAADRPETLQPACTTLHTDICKKFRFYSSNVCEKQSLVSSVCTKEFCFQACKSFPFHQGLTYVIW